MLAKNAVSGSATKKNIGTIGLLPIAEKKSPNVMSSVREFEIERDQKRIMRQPPVNANLSNYK